MEVKVKMIGEDPGLITIRGCAGNCSQVLMEEVGFMFDDAHSKCTKTIEVAGAMSSSFRMEVKVKMIGEDPGHVQSGQYLWPAARYMANHLCDVWADLGSDRVIELGAGCGLVGLTAARLPNARSIVLTDYDPGSCKLLQENIELNSTSTSSSCIVEDLTWGDIAAAKTLVKKHGGEFHLVVGSDLIYSRDVIKPLLTTVANVLSIEGIFALASSFDIGIESTNFFNAMARELGLTITDIAPLSADSTKLQYITKESVFDCVYEEMMKKKEEKDRNAATSLL